MKKLDILQKIWRVRQYVSIWSINVFNCFYNTNVDN